MGRTWRRVTEAVRQTLGGPIGVDKDFMITSNARNEAMFKEASDFSVHIRTLERDLLAMQKQVTGQFANLQDILITPLPKIYDRVDHNDHHAIAPRGDTTVTIGRAINYDRLSDAMSIMKGKIEEEVFAPMHEWMKDFKRVQVEMKRLEALRLELDSRKRTVVSLDKDLSAQREKCMRQASARVPQATDGGASGGGAPSESGMSAAVSMEDLKLQKLIEKTEERKSKKDQNLRMNQELFDQLEEAVFKKLETLIMDAASLREYASSSLVHIQECFAIAITAFEVSSSQAGAALDPTSEAAYAPMPVPESKKPGDKSLLRALANKLVSVRPPTNSSAGGRGDHEQGSDQQVHHQAATMAAYDAATPAGKILPASALPAVEVDVPRATWASGGGVAATTGYASSPKPQRGVPASGRWH